MILLPSGTVRSFGHAKVTIEDLLLGVEMEGVAWAFETLDGWLLGGGVETSFAPRPSAHGTFDGPAYRRERIISLTGVCVAASPTLAEEAADRLAATLADGSLGTLTVETGRVLSARVRLSDTPQAELLNDTSFAWALQFTAPDYRKYGGTDSVVAGLPEAGGGLVFPVGNVLDFGEAASSGDVSVTNSGTAPTEPSITVSGPFAQGFEVTHIESGRRLRYAAPVGGPIVLDSAEGRASTDGQDRTRNLTVREWFTIPPRTQATFRLSSLGSETAADGSSMRVDCAPAYY